MFWPGLWCLLLCNSAYGQQESDEYVEKEAVFTTAPLNKMVNEGDKIRLPCFVEKIEGFVLLWQFGDSVLSVGGRVIESDLESRLDLEEEDNGIWLVINNAIPSDEGDYMCRISAFTPKDIVHSVVIRTRPEVKINTVDKEVIAVHGDSVTLTCRVEGGHPDPEVSWSRLHSTLDNGLDSLVGSSLTLSSLSHHHAGEYVCKGDNGYNAEGGVDSVTLIVEHAPVVKEKVQFVHSSQGLPLTLNCTMYSYPLATVAWYAGSEPILEGDVSQSVLNSTTQVDSLTVTPSVAGNNTQESLYSCVASNKYGNTTKVITISSKPGKPIFSNCSQQDGNYRLEWSSISHIPLKSFLLDILGPSLSTKVTVTPNADNHSWTGNYLVTDLQFLTTYKARVTGTNSHGDSPVSDWFSFGLVAVDQSEELISNGSNLVPCLSRVVIILYIAKFLFYRYPL